MFVYNSITLNTSADIQAHYAAIMGNGNDSKYPTINIKGGEITSDTTALYLPQPKGVTTISGGTITGVGEALREQNPDILIWAIEPEHAAILSGKEVGSHIQMGIGDGVIPKILHQDVYQDIVIVTDEEALATARELAAKEGLMCGITGGTNVAAALRMAKKLGKGKTVVTILPDTAERYFSTELFDA